MRCEELMSADVAFVRPSDDVRHAATLMKARNIGFLPVCSDARKVVGVITDRDIAVRCVAEGRASSTAVREVMTREVVACRPEDDVVVAERAMVRHRRSRILCLGEHQYLLGVISLSDLSRAVPGGDAEAVLEGVSERERASPRKSARRPS
ncbi:MAG: CBS domain-containing protein [Labilithrix sp.]|nr:CBS domain-containing protein [Labilithrix sp.]